MKQLQEKPSQHRPPGIRVRWNYFFDRTIAGSTAILMLWLAAFSATIVAAATLLMSFGLHPTDGEPLGYIDAFWHAMGAALDPAAADPPGWGFRGVMLAVAIIGILIVSTIIGVLTSGLENKLNKLRRGRSVVIERNHTVILGWSTKIAAAVRELAIANEDNKRRDRRIVILADKDKVEMEEYLATHVEDMKGSKVICRTGDPCDLDDLKIVRWGEAKSILLFSDHGDEDDALILKRVMALLRIGTDVGRGEPPVIAEVVDRDNYEAISNMGMGNVQIVQPPQMITRIILQAARDPGLSIVYEELLNFEGSEFYPYPNEGSEPHEGDVLSGLTFRELSMSFKESTVVGILPAQGDPIINPPGTTLLGRGDTLLVIAEDDAEIGCMEQQPLSFDAANIVDQPQRQSRPESYIVIGWHRWADILLLELDQQLAPGSALEVIYDPRYTDGPGGELLDALKNVKVTTQSFNTCRRSELQRLDLSTVNEFILLSYRDRLETEEADSKTLLTLLHLREIVSGTSRTIGIITELLVAQNRALARRGHHREDDFVASEEMVSNLMVQLSENTKLKKVFDCILTTEGAELHLRPAGDYVKLDEKIQFGAIVEEGFSRSETVVGILDRTPGLPSPDLQMPIDKDEWKTLGVEDSIVVFAED